MFFDPSSIDYCGLVYLRFARFVLVLFQTVTSVFSTVTLPGCTASMVKAAKIYDLYVTNK